MKTVLVVDDVPTVRFALAEGLADRRRGIKVATAGSGLEAITVLEAERVDLVRSLTNSGIFTGGVILAGWAMWLIRR
jgi:CheY-like chemotaxis protein